MRRMLILLLCGAVMWGCCRECPVGAPKVVSQHERLTQVSTIGALMEGVYDGQMTCADLLKYGDFGLGTFEGLDGEMAVLDGVVYQIKSDGKVYRPEGSVKTPFAVTSFWREGKEFALSRGMNFGAAVKFLDGGLSDKNIFYAARIHGKFSKMKTRSVPAQVKPYPPLAEAAKHQSVFEREEVEGTVLGFRIPEYMKDVNVAGWHLHFLSDDRSFGGHILDFEIEEAGAQVDAIREFFMMLPEQNESFAQADLARERGGELEKVEGKH